MMRKKALCSGLTMLLLSLTACSFSANSSEQATLLDSGMSSGKQSDAEDGFSPNSDTAMQDDEDAEDTELTDARSENVETENTETPDTRSRDTEAKDSGTPDTHPENAGTKNTGIEDADIPNAQPDNIGTKDAEMQDTSPENTETENAEASADQPEELEIEDTEMPTVKPGKTASVKSRYTDQNGDTAIIPSEFTVSDKKGEQTIRSGLVIVGPDKSEYVWIPTTQTELAIRDFGSYFSGDSLSADYHDETELASYQDMVKSTKQYGGFYMGRFEASYGSGNNISNYIPASKRVKKKADGRIWVQFSPQDTTTVCQNIYADNETVQGFFPWGINYDTTLQWLIDSGCKTKDEVADDSTSWGNYSNDSFSKKADGKTTGQWEETNANNIYDLAGNNWEWTQERFSTDSYVMRGGGYNLMGGPCPGSSYPAALRDPLPGNDHHPNVTFRIALYIK